MIFEGVSIKNRCFLDFSILSYLRVKIPLRCFMMSPKSTSPNHSKSHSFAYCGLKLPISIQRADSESSTPRVSESTLVVHTSVWVYTSALISRPYFRPVRSSTRSVSSSGQAPRTRRQTIATRMSANFQHVQLCRQTAAAVFPSPVTPSSLSS